jgi:cytochrome c oxidase cbb3-type subunit 3
VRRPGSRLVEPRRGLAEVAEAKAAQAVYLDKLAATDVTEERSDPELVQFAIAGGASTFKVYCAQCHGSGAQGGPGYPNLNDDAWIWGGTIDQIYLTIAHGIRYDGDEDTRVSEMPAFGPKTALPAMARMRKASRTSVRRGFPMASG